MYVAELIVYAAALFARVYVCACVFAHACVCVSTNAHDMDALYEYGISMRALFVCSRALCVCMRVCACVYVCAVCVYRSKRRGRS